MHKYVKRPTKSLGILLMETRWIPLGRSLFFLPKLFFIKQIFTKIDIWAYVKFWNCRFFAILPGIFSSVDLFFRRRGPLDITSIVARYPGVYLSKNCIVLHTFLNDNCSIVSYIHTYINFIAIRIIRVLC